MEMGISILAALTDQLPGGGLQLRTGGGQMWAATAAANKSCWLTLPGQLFYSYIWNPGTSSTLLTDEWCLLRQASWSHWKVLPLPPASFSRYCLSLTNNCPSPQHANTWCDLCVAHQLTCFLWCMDVVESSLAHTVSSACPPPLEMLKSQTRAFNFPSGWKWWYESILAHKESTGWRPLAFWEFFLGNFWGFGLFCFKPMIKERRQIMKALP